MRTLLLPLLLLASLPTLFAQKQNQPAAVEEQKVVTATILLSDKNTLETKSLVAALKSDWKINADSASTRDKTVVFSVPGATVMIAHLDYPVPAAEIKAGADLSWLWKNAAPEALRHQSQVVISVIGAATKTVELYKILTKVAGATLENTHATGYFINDRYLLLPKNFVLSAARNMLNEETLPLYCWVYFGMLQESEGASGYTYGLQDFGMQEMEVVNSKNTLTEVHSMLYELTGYLLQKNVRLQDGQTFEGLEDLKLPVRLSKAAFLQGQTMKLEF